MRPQTHNYEDGGKHSLVGDEQSGEAGWRRVTGMGGGLVKLDG